MKRCAAPIRAWDGAQDVDDAPCEQSPVLPDGKCAEHTALTTLRRARHRASDADGFAAPLPEGLPLTFYPDSGAQPQVVSAAELAWLEPSE